MRRPFPYSQSDAEEAVFQVIDQEGHVFGPIDRNTLQTWADENRLTPGMMVLDESGTRIEPGVALLNRPVGKDVDVPGYQTPRTPEGIHARKAKLGSRLAAFLVDFTLAFVLYNSVEFIAGLLTLRTPGADAWPIWGYLRYLYPLMVAAFFVTRDLWMEGGSIGKHLLGLQVVRHGHIAKKTAMVRRNLLFAFVALLPFKLGAPIAVPLLIIFGLVELALLFTGKRLGDRFAGTRVYQRQP